MKKVILRERMDFGDPPPPRYKDDLADKEYAEANAWSLLHRVWDDQTDEVYSLGTPPFHGGKSSREMWDILVGNGQLPQPVGENSEWGDGLPPPERDVYFESLK